MSGSRVYTIFTCHHAAVPVLFQEFISFLPRPTTSPAPPLPTRKLFSDKPLKLWPEDACDCLPQPCHPPIIRPGFSQLHLS